MKSITIEKTYVANGQQRVDRYSFHEKAICHIHESNGHITIYLIGEESPLHFTGIGTEQVFGALELTHQGTLQ